MFILFFFHNQGHFDDNQVWNYTTSAPTDDHWFDIDYKCDNWLKGKAGFGTHGTQDLTVRTEWKTNDIWLRKEFSIVETNFPKHPVLHIFYDDTALVYINGQKVNAKFDPYQTSYSAHDLQTNQLKSGKNVIAIHVHQLWGGQGIDVGIYDTEYLGV